MRFHWLRCRESQGQFQYHWDTGATNWADYSNKHHPLIYQKSHRPKKCRVKQHRYLQRYLQGFCFLIYLLNIFPKGFCFFYFYKIIWFSFYIDFLKGCVCPRELHVRTYTRSVRMNLQPLSLCILCEYINAVFLAAFAIITETLFRPINSQSS